jgi:hypothetical protein
MSMGAKRVIWHAGFESNLRRRGPRSMEVRSEVRLAEESLRLDYLLVRKLSPEGEQVDDSARTLRRLWPLLPRVSVVEYKSPSHPYRTGDLDRLIGYTHIYYANQCALPRKRADGSPRTPAEGGPEVRSHEELAAVLAVAARTPSLIADVEDASLRWEDLGGGYHRLTGGSFALHVVELDVVGPTEGDDLLHSLGHGMVASPEARRFWMELVGSKETAMSMHEMEGYKELLEKFIDTFPAEDVLSCYPPEQRLAGLPPEQVLPHYAPEQRLAGLPPEQRLAGLDRDHQALALPLELLRLLPEDYLRSLSPEVEAEIRRRLWQNGH